MNWNIYFNKKHKFLLEIGKTEEQILEIFKKSYDNYKNNGFILRTNKDQIEYKLMMKALEDAIKKKEPLVC